MVVRNPIRNISQPEHLQLACFVAMMMVLQKRRLEAERRYISDDTLEDGSMLRSFLFTRKGARNA